jgi:hypothetical protein
MAVAEAGMAPGEGVFDFDLRIADVIAYQNLTIVVFTCDCRWVAMTGREPMLIACGEHRDRRFV